MTYSFIFIKNKLKTILFLITIVLLTSASYANSKPFRTNNFDINLPINMKLDFERKENGIFQYVFNSVPYKNTSYDQIRITVVNKAPNKNDFSDWELKALGFNIALFAETFHIDLSKQKDFLGKKPEKVILGKHKFSGGLMNATNMQVYFLVSVEKNKTYNITLVSVNKNPTIRKANMKRLIESIKSIITN